jgi:tyrosyl-tRNA synthetase
MNLVKLIGDFTGVIGDPTGRAINCYRHKCEFE